MMTETMLPNALSEMRKFRARVEFPPPNTEEKKREAASSLDLTRLALGTRRQNQCCRCLWKEDIYQRQNMQCYRACREWIPLVKMLALSSSEL